MWLEDNTSSDGEDSQTILEGSFWNKSLMSRPLGSEWVTTASRSCSSTSFKQVGVVCDTQGSNSEEYEILLVCNLIFMYFVALKNRMSYYINWKICLWILIFYATWRPGVKYLLLSTLQVVEVIKIVLLRKKEC